MKGVLTVAGLALICFLIGVGASTIIGTPARAELNHCSGFCGSQIVCASIIECGQDSMYYRCYQWEPALLDCEGPWTCGCVELGCGPNCNIP